MKRFAVGKLLLQGCLGSMVWTGALHATVPPRHVVSTVEEAHAFDIAAPFVFEGQPLDVQVGFTTARPVELHQKGEIMVAAGQRFELAGPVSSAAAPTLAPLEKRGHGVLALTGANHYTSNTVLREGGLYLAGASPLGRELNNLEQYAGTVLELAPGVRVNNFIQVKGADPGNTALPGLDGRVEWRVGAGLATVGSVNAPVPIRKTGDGSLRIQHLLMGGSTVAVESGALLVDGDVAAHIDVGAGARLEGSGNFAAARMMSGGMVAPGGRDMVGRLSSWGDIVFDPGSVYHVNVLPDGNADLLDLIGEARLAGRVWAEAGAGDWAAERRYQILHANAGLSGTRFDEVKTNLAFLDPALEYDNNNVYLVLQRNGRGIGDVGETPEDQEIGDVIDAIPLTPLQDAIVGMNPDQARSALRGLSGSWHASVRSFLMDDSRHVRDAVLAGVSPAFGREAEGAALLSHEPGVRPWAHAYTATGRRGRHGTVEADRQSSRGLVVGADAPVGTAWRLGGVLAVQHAHLRREGRPASASVDSAHVGLSAYGRWSGMRVAAGLLRAWHRIDSRRRVAAGPLQQALAATYTGRSWHAVLEIAPQLRELGRWSARMRDASLAGPAAESGPFLRHDWVRLDVPAFDEAGGPGAHGVHSADSSMHATTLGWRVSRNFQWKGRPLSIGAEAGWRRVLGSEAVSSTQHFVLADNGPNATSRSFTSTGQPKIRDALSVGLRLMAAPWRHSEVALNYSGLFGSGFRGHSARAELRRWF